MTVKSTMPIGVTDFKELRENYYLVDKTDFIRQFIDGRSAATLITRPRRFGKTLFMSMMDWFFSIDKKEASEHLFDGLAIDRAGEKYMAQRGSRPVISFSLKGIEGSTWTTARNIFCRRIRELYKKYYYLWENSDLKDDDKTYAQNIVNLKGEPEDYLDSLKDLSRMLFEYHGIKPVMLIDEYDAPLQYAYDNGYYDEAVTFFRTCYNYAFKDNEYLDFAIITGVLRVAKESIFSGLNSLDVCSVTTDKYTEACGFTPAEVESMANELGFADKLPEIKEWYDGYHFSQSDIYNPWSVINYVDKKFTPQPYWINTSSNGILEKLLSHADKERFDELDGLIKGEPICTVLNEGIMYESIGRNAGDLYNMLLTSGYLTIEKNSGQLDRRPVDMIIPNKEICMVYADEILRSLMPTSGVGLSLMMLEYMLRGNAEKFESSLKKTVEQIASTFDTAKDKQEIFYHGLMLGFTATLHGNGYQVKSEGEAGYGRFDVAIFPLDNKNPGVILEFKVADDEKSLEKAAEDAKNQINDKGYIAEFDSRGVRNVWKYGIAFCGKNVLMR